MAFNSFIYLLAFTLLFTSSLSSDPAGLSPAPAPQLGSDNSPPLPVPSASPPTASPPSLPPPSDLPPSPSLNKSPTPSPAPETAADNDLSNANVKSEEPNKSSSGGMSSGKKAGIAIGVVAAAFVVGFGAILYKKRQQNIRRAEFSSAARREFL
ncbi:hypothetical protein L1987_81892 [Smallanthus sonchifolius]|uniref:Uncharacterized protein n=1 Tax=Smallanthus sonchifolius TaxID=185202 RepID=A0ACB8YRZ2_9ASTR|nr:hypothetical protein L1987_81892 [Smallanthus sonchifolius]